MTQAAARSAAPASPALPIGWLWPFAAAAVAGAFAAVPLPSWGWLALKIFLQL